MHTWLLRAAIAIAAVLTLVAVWEQLPGTSANRLILYPVLLFPYGLYAVMTRDRGSHLAVLLGGVLFLAGLWLWVLLQGPALLSAVVTHLIASTVIGITATLLGRRARINP
jgi:uncharacterized membrane protein YjjB (DUF3815 family)